MISDHSTQFNYTVPLLILFDTYSANCKQFYKLLITTNKSKSTKYVEKVDVGF